MRTTAMFCVLALLLAPTIAWSQHGHSQHDHYAQHGGTADAKGGTYHDGLIAGQQQASGQPLHIIGGCCLGLIGVGIAFLLTPDVPVHMVTGRSPEYIMGFREGFISESRKKNMMYAAGGCLAGSVISTGLWLLSAATTAATAPSW